ncbi:hypothetical protein BS50DRAFT_331960 [Corynespora cassiicola Philippines]|uniref:Uncharacterized protein n=1 Tax=Corynespora cassiicola Philippines TaxID=1448308 RepID=A0A2T2NUK6_CORCC|nr:hypothetical protein BS50DRAFT_331960 [Corynespora cassiicola Philippines]
MCNGHVCPHSGRLFVPAAWDDGREPTEGAPAAAHLRPHAQVTAEAPTPFAAPIHGAP